MKKGRRPVDAVIESLLSDNGLKFVSLEELWIPKTAVAYELQASEVT